MATIYIMHGFIGYGKTTVAKKLAIETGAVRFNHDDWMIDLYGTNPPKEHFESYCKTIINKITELTEEFIKREQDVILDFGCWSRKDRDKYRNNAEALGAKLVLYSIGCDLETAKERVRKRTDEMPEGALFIDDNAMDELWQHFKPLEDDEEHILIDNF